MESHENIFDTLLLLFAPLGGFLVIELIPIDPIAKNIGIVGIGKRGNHGQMEKTSNSRDVGGRRGIFSPNLPDRQAWPFETGRNFL